MFNFFLYRPSSRDKTDKNAHGLWIWCKKLFGEELFEKKVLDNSVLVYGFAWNLCFCKRFIKLYTNKKTSYIKELRRENLMLKEGEKDEVNKELLKNLKTGFFYVPTLVNHAACDFFCALNIDKEKVLICIKIKSGKTGLSNYEKDKFPELLNKAIKEVNDENKIKKRIFTRSLGKNKVVRILGRAEYLVLRPGVNETSEIEDSPFFMERRSWFFSLKIAWSFWTTYFFNN